MTSEEVADVARLGSDINSIVLRRAFQMGVERSEHSNLNGCCGNGDRRFLRDVTKDKIQNIEQKSRTTPRGDTIQSHAK
jgi:hypothetical protein